EACTRALSEWDVRRREPERQRTRAGRLAPSLLPQPLITCRHEPSRKPRDTGRLLEELGKAQRASDGIVRSGEAAANRGAEPVHQVTDVDVLHEPLLRFWHEHVLCAREREPRYPVGESVTRISRAGDESWPSNEQASAHRLLSRPFGRYLRMRIVLQVGWFNERCALIRSRFAVACVDRDGGHQRPMARLRG